MLKNLSTFGGVSLHGEHHSNYTTFQNVTVDGDFNIHYLEAGDRSLPTLLLLHGFPTASYQFEKLAGLLAHSYHIVAPDYPGFGLTTYPSDFVFTFDNIALVVASLLVTLQISSFALYLFDYGAPIGLRIALKQPAAVKAIISQSGNAYDIGFRQDFWQPIFELWNTSNSATARQSLIRDVMTLEATNYVYFTGVSTNDIDKVDVYRPVIDYLSNLKGADNHERQLDLFYDYRTNPGSYYAKFQNYLRTSQVPLLAIWGKYDPAFTPSGAEAFKKDSPHAEIKLIDAGHFALETKAEEIAMSILEFLPRVGFRGAAAARLSS